MYTGIASLQLILTVLALNNANTELLLDSANEVLN